MNVPKPDEIAVSPATSPPVTPTDYNSRTYRYGSPKSFHLKPGEFLHDARNDDKSLVSFAKHLSAMNVFDVFFDYTRVITRDSSKSATEFRKHEELNRYQDVRCLDETRVHVPGSDGHDYIHANYCDGFREEKRFIITQAPLPSTVERFWAMVWQEKATVIVSLTVLDGESVPVYLPTAGAATIEYGPYSVENNGVRHIRDTYEATLLNVKKSGDDKVRRILHIIFYTWPDKGNPLRPSELINLVQDVNYNRERLLVGAKEDGWMTDGEKSPIVVHCLAGVGRSGVYVALDICQQKLDYTYANHKSTLLDVRDTVQRLRSQRYMAVQKPEQYLFLHLAMMEYALRMRYFDDVSCVDTSRMMFNKKE
uniref:Protein tyrosine phosphatase n=1 Tax=Panagrolaimus sp. JU765 TaxID=591449 RepID=A0AC34QW41_9BILA